MKAIRQENIQEVWEQFFKNRDDITRNFLICHYLPTVKYTAERLHSRLPSSIELDDINSVGILGLVDAINKFDPKRNVKFETYCIQRIKGSILDELRTNDWIPRLLRKRAQQLQRVTQKLEAIFGRSPSEGEIADELEMDMNQFHQFQQDANAAVLISLDNSLSASDGAGEFREIDILTNHKSGNPFLETQKRDIKEFIIKGFSRDEQLIIILYYFEEMTMKEIGDTLGISESRVSQMHSSIMSRLRAKINQESLLAI